MTDHRAEVTAAAVGILRVLRHSAVFRQHMPATYSAVCRTIAELDRCDYADDLAAVTAAEDIIERARRGHA